MSIEFVLMVGVLVCSVFTGLIVEAIKKMTTAEGRQTNLIAAVVSVIVGVSFGVSFGVGYILLNKLPFDTQNIISIILLVVCSWIVSMVGFDKFRQTIEQIMFKKIGNNDKGTNA